MRFRRCDKAVQKAHHRGGGTLFGSIERSILRVGIDPRFHAGEADLQDIHPVRRGMIEVLPDRRTSFLRHLSDASTMPGRVLVIHVRRMTPENRRHRALMTVPGRNRRKPVELGKTDRDIVDEKVEATRRDIVPILFAVLPTRLGNNLLHTRTKRVVVEPRLGIGQIRAPLPLEIRRLVSNIHRTLFHTHRVLLPSVVHRHTAVRYFHSC